VARYRLFRYPIQHGSYRTTTGFEQVPVPDKEIDITSETCPMTFVRVKLALEKLPSGALLAVRLRGDEPLRNVPRSAAAEGHEILSSDALPSGIHLLLIRRA
jgi:TusA-related sulfurtransferase